jgi:DNA-binding transcriptional MerR regulator
MKAMGTRLTLKQLENEIGVSGRTLRRWIRTGLLPGPLGAARASYYESTQVVRARAIAALSGQRLSLRAIRDRLAVTSAEEMAQLAGMATAPAVPTNFRRATWEVVELSESLVLMVRTGRDGARSAAEALCRAYAQLGHQATQAESATHHPEG